MKKLNLKQFIDLSNKVHNNKYDYSKVNYINTRIKVYIICPKHGEFLQTPNAHISKKQGCHKCSIERLKQNNPITIQEFIQKAKLVHGDKYDYSKSDYKLANIKVKIICHTHGKFEQIANNHLSGQGCPKCNSSKGELKIEKYLKENNIQFENQKRFKDCKNIKPLAFDFYLPKQNMCIEYDGAQHFKLSKLKNWIFNEEDLKKIKFLDNIKNKYCKNNDIKLLRIPYTEFNNINNVINNNIL